MADYIPRKAAVDALNKALFAYEDETEARFKNEPELDISEWFLHRIFVQNMNDIDRQTVLDIPAADVAPLVLGHWTIDGKCNVCGEEPLTEFDVELMNFCPNCGAKMVGNE